MAARDDKAQSDADEAAKAAEEAQQLEKWRTNAIRMGELDAVRLANFLKQLKAEGPTFSADNLADISVAYLGAWSGVASR